MQAGKQENTQTDNHGDTQTEMSREASTSKQAEHHTGRQTATEAEKLNHCLQKGRQKIREEDPHHMILLVMVHVSCL